MRSWVRSTGSLRIALPALIVALSVGGYLITSRTIHADREAAASRHAQIASVRTEGLLGRARAYAAGLGKALATEPAAGQEVFAQVADRWTAAAGLVDALWVQNKGGSQLVATYTRRTGGELRPGVDVSDWPGLGAAVRDRASAFGVSASTLASLGGEPGLYLFEAGTFGRGTSGRGLLAVFIPRGWLTSALEEDPRRLAISVEGRRLEGALDSAPAASTSFEALGRRWGIGVASEPPTGLQSILPWLALAWPIAVALIAFLIGRAIVLRRRAEREVEQIFDVSHDLLAIAGLDGYFKRVNPAFERTFGYSTAEMLSRPFTEFIHPEDLERSSEAMEALSRGQELTNFENRSIRRDGAVRWIQWSTRPAPEQGLVYSTGRDVTESRQAAEQDSALRRVATLVAHGASLNEILTAVCVEVHALFGSDSTVLARGDPDGSATVLAIHGRINVPAIGTRLTLEGDNVMGEVLRTGRPARIDDFAGARGSIAEMARELNVRTVVGVPIIVEGQIWGVAVARWTQEPPLLDDAEGRMAAFTELIATAIANAESRAALSKLAVEQAALRRVATLVARAASPTEVFAAATEEVGRLTGLDLAMIARFEPGGMVTSVAGVGSENGRPGKPWRPEPPAAIADVMRTGRAARVEDFAQASGPVAELARAEGVKSSVACPITVEGRVWGALGVASRTGSLPAETEEGIRGFTELVATAIAQTESRIELARLAEEQAALQRVATLVAEGVHPQELFAAVTEEVGTLLPVTSAAMGRLDPDGMVTTVAAWSKGAAAFPVGERWLPGGKNVMTLVLETGRPARIESFDDASGPVGVAAREAGYRSAVGTPIMVEGSLWGVATAASSAEQPLPSESEARLASFTELVATAIANTESRAELTRSRARVVAAADETRRRIERDLHDGIQQRLVSLSLLLRASEARIPPELDELKAELAETADGLASTTDDLREISRGIHPAILSEGGLAPALKTLARRAALPVELDVQADERPPEQVEVAAYYVVSEALANATKHAQASVMHVGLRADDSMVSLAIRDDGVGGADPERGSGLTGLRDRVEALGGTMEIASSPGRGTSLLARIPLKEAEEYERFSGGA